MSLESIVLVAAWAAVLIVFLAVLGPALLDWRRDEDESFEADLFDVTGPVIDVEPA